MSSKKKKFYITSSLAYTNALPHIGFAQELIQADVLARYHRFLSEETFFLTGTDEHGQKNLKAAEKAGKNPKEFTDEISDKFRNLTNVLNLSNDDFIRTTDQKRHWPTVKKVWLKLKKNGDICKKKYKGFYCIGCEAFITKKDLVNGKCPIHKKRPEIIEEENYFFKLSKYSKKIKKAIEKDKVKIIPQTRKNEILSFVKQGLKDISFSRSRQNSKWGIPVPEDKNQTIYVWSDALVNYVSALGYAQNNEKFKKFWPADVHCIGKDIIRFHAIIWLGILLSLKLKLPKIILVHGFITSGGQKMSKSLGNVVDPFVLVEKYGTDAVRYFLLREISPTEDGDFTYEKFEARYNADLAKGLGNLTARVLTMAEKIKTSRSRASLLRDKQNLKVTKAIRNTEKKYKNALDNFKFNEALEEIWKLISYCDRYIEKERPWEKSERQLLVISELLFALTNIAEMLEPFLPETSEKILKQIKAKKSKSLFPRIK
ncbi:methionine--tRNA ligase [Candidatus Parcubacteria bacterium]|nr:methionine--tRNA ligase [Candidatus Parcubacteria bacterium]